jgi:glutathione synthase
MYICFLMYPWENINPERDTTLTFIHECVLRGHKVAICTPGNLTIRDRVTSAFCQVIKSPDKVPASIKTFYKGCSFRHQMLPLAGFDCIFMRANPPMDPLMLNFLDSVKDDVFILNSIEGLREANNKLYTAAFGNIHEDVIPNTHVSKNKDYLVRQIEESKSDKMILKPLNGYGGSGVILIEKSAMKNINSLLDFYLTNSDGSSNYVILQEYVEGAEKGDIRILLLNGEPIGAVRRVPDAKDHRSNLSVGGTYEKHSLTKHELNICKKIGPKLVKDGLYFVGIDVINGKLIEVNVMSPGGVVPVNKMNKTKVQRKVIDFIEEKVDDMLFKINRRSKLRSEVQDS